MDLPAWGHEAFEFQGATDRVHPAPGEGRDADRGGLEEDKNLHANVFLWDLHRILPMRRLTSHIDGRAAHPRPGISNLLLE